MPFHLSRKKIIVFTLTLLVLVGILFSASFWFYMLDPTQNGNPDQIFIVPDGSTLSKVAEGLESKVLIKSNEPFLFWAKLMGYSRNIKAGEYRLNAHMSPLNILEVMSKGSIVTPPVTIPEGYNRMQIGALLEDKGLADKKKFISLTGSPDVARAYGFSGPDLEGYLYPDTYQFSRGLSEETIVDVMVRHFLDVSASFRDRIKASGMTLEQVVILASIVEKETGSAEERPIIASVFLNRLKKRIRLETDPTVIYGIKNFDGNLKKKDLNQYTPYNTYVIRGLPPGAIANPGREAIRAVLYPADTSYLYFVSKNDGTHHFSETLSEHNRAVRKYQKNRRNRLKAQKRK